jgi:hypothetical protein
MASTRRRRTRKRRKGGVEPGAQLVRTGGPPPPIQIPDMDGESVYDADSVAETVRAPLEDEEDEDATIGSPSPREYAGRRRRRRSKKSNKSQRKSKRA